MRIDLQDIYKDHPKLVIGGSVAVLAAFIALLIVGLSGGGSSNRATRTQASATVTATTQTTTSATTTSSSAVTTPSTSYHPSYVSVPTTSADQKLASAMEQGGAAIAKFEGVVPPSPAWTTAYPSIPPSSWHNEQRYVVAFLDELLDRNYRTQARSDLGRWAAAESAADVLPGVPSTAGDHQLYAELMEPQAVGVGGGPVPSAAQWSARARGGERQHVYDVFANENESWQELIGKGLNSRDPLSDLEDATGVIATTTGNKTTTQHFSIELYVGSALHHPGYGAWAFEEWGVR
jgi:hypothetical protein